MIKQHWSTLPPRCNPCFSGVRACVTLAFIIVGLGSRIPCIFLRAGITNRLHVTTADTGFPEKTELGYYGNWRATCSAKLDYNVRSSTHHWYGSHCCIHSADVHYRSGWAGELPGKCLQDSNLQCVSINDQNTSRLGEFAQSKPCQHLRKQKWGRKPKWKDNKSHRRWVFMAGTKAQTRDAGKQPVGWLR